MGSPRVGGPEVVGSQGRGGPRAGGRPGAASPDASFLPPTADPVVQIEGNPHCCFFNFSPKIMFTKVVKAQLWVYLRPVQHPSTVYLQILRLKPVTEEGSRHIRIRSLKIDLNSRVGHWQSIDFKHVLQNWFKQPQNNWGIEINAFDPNGNDLAVTSLGPGAEGLVGDPAAGWARGSEVGVVPPHHGPGGRRCAELVGHRGGSGAWMGTGVLAVPREWGNRGGNGDRDGWRHSSMGLVTACGGGRGSLGAVTAPWGQSQLHGAGRRFVGRVTAPWGTVTAPWGQ